MHFFVSNPSIILLQYYLLVSIINRRMLGRFGIGDFKIIRQLGEGSFSQVQLVQRKLDEKLLALKQVNMDKLSAKERNLALNQIRLLASIRSDFVISYEGSFYEEQTNNLCLLMQYADEGDLQTIINDVAGKSKMQRGLDEAFIWRTIIQVLQGLQFLHKNKIVHRDIKAANIFFVKGVAKLGDLNVSCASDSSFYSSKRGTPYYTAPEIWNGHKYTSNCDIWSLGCLAYEMCALLPPFRADSLPELFAIVCRGDYQLLSQQYSENLRTFIRLCLVTNQKQRPTASELLKNPIMEQQLLAEYNVMKQAKIQLIQPLKCPKVLRFLNTMLPGASSSVLDQNLNDFENKEDKRVTSISGSKTQKAKIRIRSGIKIGMSKIQKSVQMCNVVKQNQSTVDEDMKNEKISPLKAGGVLKKQNFRLRKLR